MLETSMQIRKDILENEHYYHIYSRSIAGYKIFNDVSDFDRFYQLLGLYRYSNFGFKYSRFVELDDSIQTAILIALKHEGKVLVRIVAYCLMPTHVHLILKQETDYGISKFMGRVLNSYSRYFNTKHYRSGPLWSSRFKNVLLNDDEQLIHLTRYIHLNPTSIELVKNPDEWVYSSFNEYTQDKPNHDSIIERDGLFDFDPKSYRKFVLDRKSYQRELSFIKSLLIEDYTG